MPLNVGCWKPRQIGLVIATLFLSGCAGVGFDRSPSACPPVVEYSRTEQARVTEEVAALPEGALIIGWLADYAVLREQARTCTQPPHQTQPDAVSGHW